MTQLEQFVHTWLNSYLSISTHDGVANSSTAAAATEVCNLDTMKSKYDEERLFNSSSSSTMNNNLYLDT